MTLAEKVDEMFKEHGGIVVLAELARSFRREADRCRDDRLPATAGRMDRMADTLAAIVKKILDEETGL